MIKRNYIIIISLAASLAILFSIFYTISDMDFSNTDTIIEIQTQTEQDVKNAVKQTIAQYDGDLSSITNLHYGEYYTFVINHDFSKILVHPREQVIGKPSVAVNNANIPIEKIMEVLDTDGEIWIDYIYFNPATGNEESKRSWLVSHEGYVFGSGYYNPIK